jgi:RND family efflux transporter MFP subunit
MKSLSKYIILLALIAGAGTIFYNKVYIPKTTYERSSATTGDLSVQVFGIGNLGAKNIYAVSAGVSAKVLDMLHDEGEWIKKGDLLAVLDSVDLPIQLNESKIGVDKAYSELIASQKELASLQAQKNLALVTYNRYKKLKKQSFASQSEYDKAKADLKVIEAQIEVTEAHINSAKTEITRSKEAVKALQEKLSRYKVYAPVDGYIIAKKAEVSQTLLLSQTLFEIVNPQDVWVKAYIDEKISGSVKLGSSATIRLRSNSEKVYKGIVKRVVAQSDAITQEREVDVVFENLPLPFFINEQAEVNIDTKEYKNIVKIKADALVYKDQKSGVWVMKNSKAHFVIVKVLAISNGVVAVDGLDKNSEILIANIKKKTLKEGMDVH